MGCTFAHPKNGETHPRIFKVVNLDNDGREINPGKIEVTDSELIFHPKDKASIHWPLRGLRRYGFDVEFFSFESGRRCPTGVGFFAFQCQRAEALFNLLQDCVQRVGQDDHPISQSVSPQLGMQSDRPLIRPTTTNTGTPPPMMTVARSRPSQSTGATSGVVSLQSFPSMSSPSAHEYINTEMHNGPSDLVLNVVDPANITVKVGTTSSSLANSSTVDSGIQYAQLDLHRNSVDTKLLAMDNNNSSQATYMNVQAEGNEGKPRSSSLTIPTTRGASCKQPPLLHVASVPDPRHEYLNLEPKLKMSQSSSAGGNAGKCPQYIPAKPPAMLEASSAKDTTVTYIEVDFTNGDETAMTNAMGGSSSSRVVNGFGGNGESGNSVRQSTSNGISGRNMMGSLSEPPSTQRTESYAVIDFNKTAAINAKNARDDDGRRKTRHDSSIEELH